MELRAHLPCPQCDAPLSLEEGSSLVECAYCGVRNLVVPKGVFRFFLPLSPKSDIEAGALFYVPYLRFRGVIYSASLQGVHPAVVDITRLATTLPGLPPSLGLRPQALSLGLSPPDGRGTLLRPTVKAAQILKSAVEMGPGKEARVLHRAFVGENISMIYLPLVKRGGEFWDGVTWQRLGSAPKELETIAGRAAHSVVEWVGAWPALCPRCGWDLRSQGKSCAFGCGNCGVAWTVSGRGFSMVESRVEEGAGSDGELLLPFWEHRVEPAGGITPPLGKLLGPAAGYRLGGTSEDLLSYWTPAFRLSPKVYLRVSATVTLAQRSLASHPAPIPKGAFSVSLPAKEAFQSLKSVVATVAVPRQEVVTLLPRMRFVSRAARLTFLRFHRVGPDLVHAASGAAFSASMLRLLDRAGG